MATALIFGLAPAWQGSSTDLTESLKDGARSVTGGKHQAIVSNGLVIAEIDANDPMPGMKQSFAYMRGVLGALAL